jgi:Mg2+/Co2+ transporter CorB
MIEAALIICFILSLAASGFFSGTETGFLSVNRARVLHMAREGGVRAKMIEKAISDMGRTTTSILVGNNIANVMFSSVSAALAARLYPQEAVAQAIWGVLAAFLVLFLGEFTPKLLCATRPIQRMIALVPLWNKIDYVLSPIACSVQAAISNILPQREIGSKVTPETVLKILKDRKDGVKLSDFESALIGRIMVLRSKGMDVTPESLLHVLDTEEKD